MTESSIFISYSHKDLRWVERLRTHLLAAERESVISAWDERQIQPGQNWKSEISNALDTASIAILMLSADYLVSDFVNNDEVTELLRRQEEQGLRILPIVVRPCLWHTVNWLRDKQFLPKDALPLSTFTDDGLDRVLVEIVQTVVGTLARKDKTIQGSYKRETVVRSSTKVGNGKTFFISYAHEDGDFAELLQLRLEKNGYQAWRDIEKLAVGTDWRQEIDQNIRQSSAVIVILSPVSKESEYVTYEWAFACGVGVPVIPLMLKPTPIHPRLEALQFLDFTNQASRPWAKLLMALEATSSKQNVP